MTPIATHCRDTVTIWGDYEVRCGDPAVTMCRSCSKPLCIGCVVPDDRCLNCMAPDEAGDPASAALSGGPVEASANITEEPSPERVYGYTHAEAAPEPSRVGPSSLDCPGSGSTQARDRRAYRDRYGLTVESQCDRCGGWLPVRMGDAVLPLHQPAGGAP